MEFKQQDAFRSGLHAFLSAWHATLYATHPSNTDILRELNIRAFVPGIGECGTWIDLGRTFGKADDKEASSGTAG
jgi:hypothetical protein